MGWESEREAVDEVYESDLARVHMRRVSRQLTFPWCVFGPGWLAKCAVQTRKWSQHSCSRTSVAWRTEMLANAECWCVCAAHMVLLTRI